MAMDLLITTMERQDWDLSLIMTSQLGPQASILPRVEDMLISRAVLVQNPKCKKLTDKVQQRMGDTPRTMLTITRPEQL